MLGLRMGKLALTLVMLLSSAPSNAVFQERSVNQCSDHHDGPCKKSSHCLPLVTPSNSTHLIVSWKNVFEGCRDEHIEEAIVAYRHKNTTLVIPINRGQKQVSVAANPCLQHTFQMFLFLTQSYTDSYKRESVRSGKFHYNNEENENYPYSGLLASHLETLVLPNICLKENRRITIPDPPEALQNCGLASFSNVEDAEFEKDSSTTATVEIVFNNPQNPDVHTSKLFEVTDIQRCQSDKSGKLSTIVLAAIVLSSTIAVCVTICLLVFFWQRRLMEKREKKMEKQNKNNIYGLYFTEDGEAIDQRTVEVVDVNEYYG